MATFNIQTTIAHDCHQRHTSQLADGTVIEEFYRQDEATWANTLFNNWFKDRGLVFGRDYWLERCPGHNVLICFTNAGEAMWFEHKYEGEL